MKLHKILQWGPGGFHDLAHKKANIWLTVTAVLAIVAVYIFVMITALVGSGSLYNESSAGLLSRYTARSYTAQSNIFANNTAAQKPSVQQYWTFKTLFAPSFTPPTATTAPSAVNQPVYQSNPISSTKSPVVPEGDKMPTPAPTPPSASQPPQNPATTPPWPPSQPPTTQPPPPASGSLISPQAGSQWSKGSIQAIKWQAGMNTGGGALAIRLQKGGQRYPGASSVIAGGSYGGPYGDYSGEFIRNNGSFDWRVPEDLPAAADYQVILISTNGRVLAESGMFSITAQSNAFQFVLPTAGALVPFDADYALRWRNPAGFSGRIDVAIYQQARGFNGLSYIAKNVPADWLYIIDGVVYFTWSVNAGNNLPQSNGNGGFLIPGDAVVIVTSTDHSLSGSSGSFTIQ